MDTFNLLTGSELETVFWKIIRGEAVHFLCIKYYVSADSIFFNFVLLARLNFLCKCVYFVQCKEIFKGQVE